MATDNSRQRVGYIFHSVSKDDLQPGDHIYAYRYGGAYSHHGIFAGEDDDDGEVIHFSGEETSSKKSAAIRANTVKEFLYGSQLRLVAYEVSGVAKLLKRSGSVQTFKSLPADEVVATAKFYLHKTLEWREYHMLFNNCENFAVYCKTGKDNSIPQNVREVGLGTLAIGIGLAAIVGMRR